jgi:hypothetical protein
VNEWRYNQSLEAAKLKHFENFDNMEERLKKNENDGLFLKNLKWAMKKFKRVCYFYMMIMKTMDLRNRGKKERILNNLMLDLY